MAVASLVLGLIALFAFQLLGPLAIWFGMRARREIRASGGAQDGEGMATAGIITGIVATIFLVLALLLLVFLVSIGLSGLPPSP